MQTQKSQDQTSTKTIKIYLRNKFKEVTPLTCSKNIQSQQLKGLAARQLEVKQQDLALFYNSQRVDLSQEAIHLRDRGIVHCVNVAATKKEALKVNFKMLDKNSKNLTQKLEVVSNTQIGTFIKTQLQYVIGLSPKKFFLVYVGKQLQEKNTFRQQLVQDNGQIIIVRTNQSDQEEDQNIQMLFKQKLQPKFQQSFNMEHAEEKEDIESMILKTGNRGRDLPKTYLRKNIQALSEAERQRFFICVKMLAVIPCHQGNEHRTFLTLANQFIKPKNLHDEMIANHATSCQHASLYFGYYHRHLMNYYQMNLNYVHEILMTNDNVEQLKRTFPPQKYGHLHVNGATQLWDQLLSSYQELNNKNRLQDQVMAHYYNPSNYRNDKEMMPPIELADPQFYPGYKLQTVDHLYNNITGSYPWHVNPKYRFTNSYEHQFTGYQERRFVNTMQEAGQGPYFANYNQRELENPYSEYEEKFLTGKDKNGRPVNPRTDPSDFDEISGYGLWNKISDLVAKRNQKLFKETGNISMMAMTKDEVLFSFGAGSRNFQYLKQSQMEGFNREQINAANNYNMFAPHYQYGQALFSPEVRKYRNFLENYNVGFENSHGTMHVNYRFAMRDGSFSIQNLMFFLYHSWVDLAMQIRLRMDYERQKREHGLSHLMKRFFTEETSVNRDFLRLGQVRQRNIETFGDYPIIEYIGNSRFQSPFDAEAIMVRGNNPRRTSQQQQTYNAYTRNNTRKLNKFKGLSQYNWNYDYEVYETLQNGSSKTTILNEAYIPDYLLQMKQDIQIPGIRVRAAFSKVAQQEQQDFFKTSSIPPQQSQEGEVVLRSPRRPQEQEQQIVLRSSPLQRQLSRKDSLKVRVRKPAKYYQKIIGTTMFANGKYMASTKNDKYRIKLKFKDFYLKQKFHSSIQHKIPEEEHNFFLKGFDVSTVGVFGRQMRAEGCPRCGDYKKYDLNLSDILYKRLPKVWRYINLEMLEGSYIVYSSELKSQTPQRRLSDTMELSVDSGSFTPLKLVNGSLEVIFTVNYIGEELQNCGIKINLISCGIQSGTIHTIATKKNFDFKDKFQFYKLVDIKNKTDKSMQSQKYLYTKVKGWIYLQDEVEFFEFDIPNYHYLIHYEINVFKRGGDKTSVIIRDADYVYKKKFFNVLNQ